MSITSVALRYNCQRSNMTMDTPRWRPDWQRPCRPQPGHLRRLGRWPSRRYRPSACSVPSARSALLAGPVAGAGVELRAPDPDVERVGAVIVRDRADQRPFGQLLHQASLSLPGRQLVGPAEHEDIRDVERLAQRRHANVPEAWMQ